MVHAGLQTAVADRMGDSGTLKFAAFEIACVIFRQPCTRKRQPPPSLRPANIVLLALLLGTTN
jgi:hypothetical protein